VTDAEVLHVERQPFLDLMSEQRDLCRETTDILSREVSFIQAALAERRRQKAVAV
jgi:CRP-like cAMP-binding protein